MDNRDKFNKVHMLKRIEKANHCSYQRQLECAKHLVHIAERQKRVHLMMLALIWQHKLEEKDHEQQRTKS